MKYPCGVIKDLMPLYIDGVCNEESKKAVEEHLTECEDCISCCKAMKGSEKYTQIADTSQEDKLNESLKKVKKSLLIKRIAAAAISAVVVIAVMGIALVAIDGLKQTDNIINYQNNITVSSDTPEIYAHLEGENYLFAYIEGKQTSSYHGKFVEKEIDGEIQRILYFKLYTNKWDDIITKDSEVSYQVLGLVNENSRIDKVYYYEGDLHNLETLTVEQLEEINKNAVLLWDN